MSREGKEQELGKDYKQILSAYKNRLIDANTTVSRLLGSSGMRLLPNHPLTVEALKEDEPESNIAGYTLSCRKCGKPYFSKEAFPGVQKCLNCYEPQVKEGEMSESEILKGCQELLDMPQIGEIRKAREIWKDCNQPYSSYIWNACVDCGKERWSFLRNGQSDNKRCRLCAAKYTASRRDITRENNPQWKGGVIEHSGYVCVLMPSHPFAYSNRYVPRARLALEQKLGRYLMVDCIAHHINGNKNDDRPENLEEIPVKTHHVMHSNKRRRDVRGRFITRLPRVSSLSSQSR